MWIIFVIVVLMVLAVRLENLKIIKLINFKSNRTLVIRLLNRNSVSVKIIYD